MVPKLRFKEFCGEWDEKRLGDVYEFKNGLNKEKEFFGKGIPIVNYMDVNKNTHLYKNTIKGRVQLTKKEIENYSAKKGDLFFTRTSETIDEIGYTAVLLDDIEDAVFSGFILRARPKNELIDFKFSGYCFMTREVRKEIIKKSSMTTRALTSGTSLKQVAFYLPLLPEQTKIADFLSTVDDKIQNQQDKITHLENIKKGFMQKIFSRKIRFKDDGGDEFPEWEEKKLGDIVEVKSGKSPNGLLDSKGEIPFFKVEQLNNSIKYQEKTPYYIKKQDENMIKSGSIIFPKRGAAILLNKIRILKQDSFMDTNLMTLTIKNNNYYNEFIYYKILVDDLSKIADTTSIPQINNKHIEPYKIKVPSLPEQTKIADFLSLFDEKIYIEKQTLEHLKDLKKGLLQQMFV